MDTLQPSIKAISALEWNGEPLVSDAPVRFDCHLEIGEVGASSVDYFNVSVVNRAWAQANLAAVPDPATAWLPPRAILMLEAPSFRALTDGLAAEIAALGPFPSWPEFARRLWPYLRWDLEGVLYPPFD